MNHNHSGEVVIAVLNSTQDFAPVTIMRYFANDNIIVATEAGILCRAIRNPFNGYIYADDVRTQLTSAQIKMLRKEVQS